MKTATRPISYRGPLLLHAAATYDQAGHKYLLESDLLTKDQKFDMIKGRLLRHRKATGVIIGQVNLVDCVRDHPSPWAAPGMWHWVFADPKIFAQQVYYPGRLGLFDAPDPTPEGLFKVHDGKTRRVCIIQEPPDIMITRPGRWGNPYKIVEAAEDVWLLKNQEGKTILSTTNGRSEALFWSLHKYRKYLYRNIPLWSEVHKLKGLRLGCFCRPDEPCHGDVLVKLVEELG